MSRGQMLNEDKGHPRVGGEMAKKSLKGFQASRRSTDADNGKILFLSLRFLPLGKGPFNGVLNEFVRIF